MFLIFGLVVEIDESFDCFDVGFGVADFVGVCERVIKNNRKGRIAILGDQIFEPRIRVLINSSRCGPDVGGCVNIGVNSGR